MNATESDVTGCELMEYILLGLAVGGEVLAFSGEFYPKSVVQLIIWLMWRGSRLTYRAFRTKPAYAESVLSTGSRV